MKGLFIFFSIVSTSLFGSEAEKLVTEQCASCHENNDLNLISISSMAQYSQSDLLYILEKGKMKTLAKDLSKSQKKLIVEYISKKDSNNKLSTDSDYCKQSISEKTLSTGSKWTSWGYDSFNSRNQTKTNINSGNINSLKLKWSFGIASKDARAQPIVVGQLIFIAGKSLYALNKETGCMYWKFQSKGMFRNAPAFDVNTKDSIYIVDSDFVAFKINIFNGEVIWKTKIPKEFESNTSSASPVQAGGFLIVPISTYETIMAIDPSYECCKSSGGMVAINTKDGEIIWNHRIEQKAEYTKKGMITRVKKFAPAGSAVWNAPGVDLLNERVFFGTGQSLQSPASGSSDAVITLDLNTGEKLWVTQTLAGDAYNVGCEIPVVRSMVCPEENGPDFDFGASIIQSIDKQGSKVIFAGQKSGWVFKLNPLNGEIDWEKKVGNGGVLGGIHFGMATDNIKLYVPISDRKVNKDYDDKAQPGLYALDFETGDIIWSYKHDEICSDRKPLYGEGKCFTGFSAPISIANNLLFAGSLDGKFSVHSVEDGKKLWEFDTLQEFQTINNYPSVGGSIDASGPVIVDDWVFINSGYSHHGQMSGNAILAFSIK